MDEPTKEETNGQAKNSGVETMNGGRNDQLDKHKHRKKRNNEVMWDRSWRAGVGCGCFAMAGFISTKGQGF
jgi:hypothetical protein